MNTIGRALDVLIIGCGNIAGGFDVSRDDALPALTHAGAFSRNPAFRISACVEPDEAKRKSFMARWNIPVGQADVEEIQTLGLTFDVISVCSPTAMHAKHVTQALSLRPRLIFCEKPITPDVSLTAQLVRQCKEARVLLATNHTRRWAPDVVSLRDQLRKGDWGPLRSLSGSYNKGLFNNGTHLVDLVHFLVGSSIPLAAALPVNDFWSDDPTVAGLLRVGQVPFHMIPAHASDYSLFELQLVTANGVLVMENGGMSWRLRRSASNPDFPGYLTLGPAKNETGNYALAMGLAAENILTALAINTPLASTGETALQAQEVCATLRNLALAAQVP